MSEYKCDRYALVKLRSRIAHELNTGEKMGYRRMYHAFCKNNWIPCKDNGEILDIGGFGAQFRIVKGDVNHNFNDLGIRFLYKAASKLGGSGEGVHGMSPIGVSARMLGLHNSTVRDVLILNGDIR